MTLSQIHRRHLSELRNSPAVLDREGLRIGDQYVMFFAEAELMRQHATYLVGESCRADVLEVGLGLGVFAEELLRVGVGSYTAIEPHEGAASLAQSRVLEHFSGVATVINTPWQLARLPPHAYDAIMYDTWPPDGHADPDFTRFVETVAIPCLRPGGRLSFFHSGAALGTTRREVLERAFVTWTAFRYTMPASQTPPGWTKPSRDFLIPIATKGDHQSCSPLPTR